MKFNNVGISGWGVYIPKYRISLDEIAKAWGYPSTYPQGLNVVEKAVAGVDEDTITMGFEAARNALRRAGVDPNFIGAVYVGTESKPYAVKPSATVIAEALGITPKKLTADLEFACRAASEALGISIGLVSSGMVKYALVIGSDTAQASPGDVLEFTAASGSAAYVIGRDDGNAAAYFEGFYSYVTDTPDFWRKENAPYPMHGESFTGEPAYFHHIVSAVKGLLEELGLRPSDFDYFVPHQPNGKFPLKVARILGFPKEKVLPGLIVTRIGNTYSASALIGLAAVLEKAKPGSRILVAPYGSGAGADAMSIVVKDSILDKVGKAPTVKDYISRKTYIDYGLYVKFYNKLRRFKF